MRLKKISTKLVKGKKKTQSVKFRLAAKNKPDHFA